VYYDGQFDDARLNVTLACTAAAAGATVINHTSATKLLKVRCQSRKDRRCHQDCPAPSALTVLYDEMKQAECCRRGRPDIRGNPQQHPLSWVLQLCLPSHAQDEKGQVVGAEVRDELGGSRKSVPVHARVVINAGGPFSDAVRRLSEVTVALDNFCGSCKQLKNTFSQKS